MSVHQDDITSYIAVKFYGPRMVTSASEHHTALTPDCVSEHVLKPHLPDAGLSPFSLLFYNNVLALPMMLIYLMSASNETTAVASYPQLHSLAFWVGLTVV